uniref:C2H2-type domain-containing protein n=1 Tax=Oncorhynchus mykiss TaxID=8022 RepID=A0A8K9Y3U6_ONCMY
MCSKPCDLVIEAGESATSDPDSPGDPEQGQKPYPDPKRLHLCSECGKRFTTAPLLKSHMKSHSGEIHHQCSVCGKCFLLFQDLKRHQEIHKGGNNSDADSPGEPDPERPFPCSVCGKRFTAAFRLKAHMKIHSGEKPHQCSVCGKAFLRPYDLKRHLLTHKGERNTRLELWYPYNFPPALNPSNVVIETGEGTSSDPDSPGDPDQELKPYFCSQCGKRFTAASSLKTHTMTHSGKKPHQCSVCGKCFLRYQDLKRHQVIHKGKRDPHT